MNRIPLIFLCIWMTVGCKETYQSHDKLPISQYEDTLAYNVGILITDGVYNTEYTAPYDIFQHTIFREGIKPMRVFTVSNKSSLVTTFEGIKVIPDFNFVEDIIPRIDILVVPSAEHHVDTDMNDRALVDWIGQVGASAQYVTSHCDGAFMLAKSGLLEGKVSTTFPSDIPLYKETFPHLDVRDSVLFVHDGKYITSVGGARSFDAALYLCHIMYGEEVTKRLGQGLVIDWELDKIRYIKINN